VNQYINTNEYVVSRIADVAPRALSAYFLCVQHSLENPQITFTRSYIIEHCARSWTMFKNDIRKLAYMFLLTFIDKGHTIEIELVEPLDEPW